MLTTNHTAEQIGVQFMCVCLTMAPFVLVLNRMMCALLCPFPTPCPTHQPGWSLLSGLSTSVGGLLITCLRIDKKMNAFMLGLAGGVMIALSILDMILPNYINGTHSVQYIALLVLAGNTSCWPVANEQPTINTLDIVIIGHSVRITANP